ncbi:hypothetical protein [Algicella marina]|uniref:Cytochrome c domain-containing protein n=1 Tax=Algicella marina TaxID=2683284 RepID=A0A6P1T650_9RHOB|nr:hypothetical protein [Algicella marina]QHQ37183.1 hypothetical protein GO499_19340 [Algicella marina]
MRSVQTLALAMATGLLPLAAVGADVDPYGSNNGTFPTAEQWQGPFRIANFDFPKHQPHDRWLNGKGMGEISTGNAEAYMETLRTFVEPSVKAMIDAPLEWDHAAEGWYDMPWTAGDREPLLGAFSGQTILADAFAEFGQKAAFTNHAVIYYNDVAAGMLGRIWANPFSPDFRAIDFPEGSIVIKALGAEVTPENFPPVEGSQIWNVFAKPFDGSSNTEQVVDTRVIQFDIVVKDSIAAPGTGWVFSTYIYDKDAAGETTWDKLVPLGAMWGNDPELALQADGGTGKLMETWVNPDAPAYSSATLGWGGRLSGPMDLAERQNILFTDGTRAETMTEVSACLSCHSTGQTPFIANLYPGPNKSFPPAGQTFFLHKPGSPEWAQWYRNREGTLPFSSVEGVVGTDYNMLLTFAINTFYASTGQTEKVTRHIDVH